MRGAPGNCAPNRAQGSPDNDQSPGDVFLSGDHTHGPSAVNHGAPTARAVAGGEQSNHPVVTAEGAEDFGYVYVCLATPEDSFHAAMPQKVVAECVATCVLVTAVVGSGYRSDLLSNDDGIALIGNALATLGILYVLITAFGKVGSNFGGMRPT